MKRRILIGAGALVLAATPAALGLWGNTSFAESVPVPVPVSGQVVTVSPSPRVDDHGGETPRDQRVEPGDDRGGASAGTDDVPGSADDHGGATPRDARVEPGDDRATQGATVDDSAAPSTTPEDSSGSGRGSDDTGSGRHGGDRGGEDD